MFKCPTVFSKEVLIVCILAFVISDDWILTYRPVSNIYISEYRMIEFPPHCIPDRRAPCTKGQPHEESTKSWYPAIHCDACILSANPKYLYPCWWNYIPSVLLLKYSFLEMSGIRSSKDLLPRKSQFRMRMCQFFQVYLYPTYIRKLWLSLFWVINSSQALHLCFDQVNWNVFRGTPFLTHCIPK